MSYCQQVATPTTEPVSLAYVKRRLRLPDSWTGDDALLGGLITGSREDGERLSGLTLSRRQFTQGLDSFPYFTDTIQGQQAYPPSYYSLPRYSTTLWNYSQLIKLEKAPLISVENFIYIGTDGREATLQPGVDFIIDPETRLARIFPMVGRYWPACLYTPNAVKIVFTAGFGANPAEQTTFGLPSPPPNPPNQQTQYKVATGIPQAFIDAIASLAVYRFLNPGVLGMPAPYECAFQSLGIIDFAPTRG